MKQKANFIIIQGLSFGQKKKKKKKQAKALIAQFINQCGVVGWQVTRFWFITEWFSLDTSDNFNLFDGSLGKGWWVDDILHKQQYQIVYI